MRLFVSSVTIAVIVGCSLPACAQTVLWIPRMQDAEPAGSGMTTYRAYAPTEEISVTLTLVNDSTQLIKVAPPLLVNTTKTQLFEGERRVAVRQKWDRQVRSSTLSEALSIVPGQEIVLTRDAWIEWEFRLRRTEDVPFTPGDYRIEITPSARETIRMGDDRPWNGRANLDVLFLSLRLDTANTPDAVAKQQWLAGSKAIRDGDNEAALRFFRAALNATPDNESLLAGIGLAQFRMGRFREARGAYERVFSNTANRHGAVPMYLACCYVGLDDEANARRVLQSLGLAEAAIQSQIRECRQTVARVRR